MREFEGQDCTGWLLRMSYGTGQVQEEGLFQSDSVPGVFGMKTGVGEHWRGNVGRCGDMRHGPL